MFDNVPAIVPPAATQDIAPTPERPPLGESTMPAPTAEQMHAADRVFAASAQRHPAVALLGVLTSAALLRDVALDTFDTSGADDDEEERAKDTDAKDR